MKKLFVLSLLFILGLMPVIAGGSQESGDMNGKEQKTVQLFISGKSVWGEPMNTVVEKFNETYPDIRIEVEVVGGGADYHPVLASRVQTKTLPDIFMIAGAGDYAAWQEHLDDLSDMEVVDNFLPISRESAYYDGKLMGLPSSIEGYGYIYNKKLFKQAGITKVPETFTELSAAVDKLNAAGITPFVSGYGTWWVISNHQLNVPFAMQDDPFGFIEKLNNGSATIAGNEQFLALEKLINLVKENTAKDPLTEDHNMQVSLFAGEQAAMIQQGNWKEAAILDANPDIEMGLVPLAIGENAATSGRIPVGVPWYWVVSKDSAVKEEARIFLNWLLNEAPGQEQLVTSLNSIPAYDNFDVELSGGISSDVLAYSKAGKTIHWTFGLWPQGFTQNASDILQEYVAGKITFAEVLDRMDKSWQSLLK
ncbi:MAG: carbohydrate ABC transporter substrate-binding protein [Spirochaetales bacterium]|nr:carbohydrate ABC transporter substrate-binding protein [Spirochaetales bacterium]